MWVITNNDASRRNDRPRRVAVEYAPPLVVKERRAGIDGAKVKTDARIFLRRCDVLLKCVAPDRG